MDANLLISSLFHALKNVAFYFSRTEVRLGHWIANLLPQEPLANRILMAAHPVQEGADEGVWFRGVQFGAQMITHDGA